VIEKALIEDASLWALYAGIIMSEVNVKGIEPVRDEERLKSASTLNLALNNAVLGKRLPEKMKQIIPASKKGEWKRLEDGRVEIMGEVLLEGEYSIRLEPNKTYEASAQAISTNDALVILDVALTPELIAEGLARDLVRLVQDARKSAGLHVTDNIALRLQLPDALVEGIKTHGAYVAEQVLATAVTYGAVEGDFTTEQMLDGKAVGIGITRAQRAAA
jgi:isoleucyl-tRNA synthetase